MTSQYAHHSRYLRLRLSPTYHRVFRRLVTTDSKPGAHWREWQFETLRGVLQHAYDNVPYYQEAFRVANVNPHTMRSLEDIVHYPLLTKEAYRQEPEAFLARGERVERLMRAYTGGTSGEPVPLFRRRHDLARERAFRSYTYRMLGIPAFCRTVYIRGPVRDDVGRFHLHTEFGQTLRLSSHNLSKENLDLYVRLMRAFRPRLLFATPSVTQILCQHMEEGRLEPIRELEWAFTPSENLYRSQQELIERTLDCRVCTSYGHTEHAVSASRCVHSDLYHVLPQYGYTELLREDGTPVCEEGEMGEIVGTAFTNSCCPLIRYRTGDRAVFTKEKCPCGREFPMWKRIEGRDPAIALSRQGTPVSIGPELLCTIMDETYLQIRQFSVEQHEKGELKIWVTPANSGAMGDIERYFQEFFAKRCPGGFTVSVERRRNIDLTSAGKHAFFVQHCTD